MLGSQDASLHLYKTVNRSVGRSVHHYFYHASANIFEDQRFSLKQEEEFHEITSSYNRSIKYEDASLALWALLLKTKKNRSSHVIRQSFHNHEDASLALWALFFFIYPERVHAVNQVRSYPVCL